MRFSTQTGVRARETALTRLRVLIRGKVQGIGYRWFVQETAGRMGMGGWVRNLDNGDVELEAEGQPDALKRFLETLKTAHPYARVDSVESAEIPALDDGKRFIIR